jgi:ATP-dependent DNA helicase RecG
MPEQLSLLEILERPTLDALFKPDAIFGTDNGQFITALKEDTRFDRKSGRVDAKGLAVCLSGFGNGPAVEGGVVAVGIEKNGTVTGCKHLSETRLQEIESAGRDLCPDGRFETRKVGVTNYKGENDFLVLIRVFYVESRLVKLTNGEAYCRESDKCRRLGDTEREEIRISKGERSFELEPCALNYQEDFRTADIAAFVRRVRADRSVSNDVTSETILQSMRLGRSESAGFKPNNVCALMFARDPRRAFPGAYIHFLRYNGVEAKSGSEYNVVKDRIIEGTVLELIRETAAILDANLREFTTYKNGKFHTLPEYPRDAWYEMVVNACVHRSYHARTVPIFVRMFDDRLVVESPGSFMPSITPENLVHKPRNPFLMFVLREYGEVRCISEGTARIKREMNEANLPAPVFRGTDTSVTVELQNEAANRTNSLDSEAYKMLGEAISFSLDPDEKRIVNYIIENGRINVSDALRILSTTYWHTAKAKLTRLERRLILKHHTSKVRDPNAYYSLRKPE